MCDKEYGKESGGLELEAEDIKESYKAEGVTRMEKGACR